MRRILAILLASVLSCAFPALADVATGNGNVPIPVPATQGGTGLTTFTTNCVVSATNSSTLNCTTTPTLTGTNFTGVPFSGVTGTVPCNQGGTGQTSYAVGDIPYASASCTISKLAAVASGSVLASNGVTAAPIYTSAPAISGANITAASIPDSALNANIPAQTCTSWTPSDQSGASLTLTLNGTQYYCKEGTHGTAWFDLTYPSTANASAAAVSLPFTCQSVNFAGAISQSSLTLIYAPTGNGTIFRFFREPNTGGGAEANLTISTGHFVGSVSCYTTS